MNESDLNPEEKKLRGSLVSTELSNHYHDGMSSTLHEIQALLDKREATVRSIDSTLKLVAVLAIGFLVLSVFCFAFLL